jgi:hypothetical protein
MGDDEGGGHDLKAEDAGECGGAEGAGDERGVVAGLFKQCSVDAMKDSGEVCAGPAAGIEDTDGGAGETGRLIEFCAEETIDAFDHVLDDRLGRVPHAKVLTKLGIEGFEKRLVKVGDCLVFTKGIEKGWLDAIERFSSEVEYLLQGNGIEGAGLGHFVEQFRRTGTRR